ncbi:hypothetical protein DFQ28_000274 [Apophysomyces sp. BC1034]|nr:hypothetical protein DFQ30_008121 [Apophysomyces sp. BC1015]KAG0182256.1 hypothetical protein DFQ29_005139 [Apophysomyces sp. BC1021]KAG0191388.1 hypothetical protein DFQ28_000274 [Apophysomyces sp. BC1034]
MWGKGVKYNAPAQPALEWKKYVTHLVKQQRRAGSLTFDFVSEDNSCVHPNRKRKLSQHNPSLPHKNPCRHTIGEMDSSTELVPDWRRTTAVLEEMAFDRSSITEASLPFQVQDPLVYDIDAKTNQGIVATGKHRKCNIRWQNKRSEHRILFWHYPSWRLMGQLDLTFAPSEVLCQIVGIQSIQMPYQQEKVRLFAVAVGQPPRPQDELNSHVGLWRAVFVYRLFDDGSTQCLGHLQANGSYISRDVFFFSDSSWGKSDCGEWESDEQTDCVKDWMKITAPEYTDYDPNYTVFMFAFGPMYPDINGCGQLIRFDLRPSPGIVDPSIAPVAQNLATGRFEYIGRRMWGEPICTWPGKPAELILAVWLGSKVSCMMHFRDPPHMNHLICTGSYTRDELCIYDWRFGVIVGTLPWLSPHSLIQEEDLSPGEFTSLPHEPWRDVRPWGLESTMVLPSLLSEEKLQKSQLSQRGFRLIAVAYNGVDKLEIKIWDTSYLLDIMWNAGMQEEDDDYDTAQMMDYTDRFHWWKRGSRKLQQVALHMIEAEEAEELFDAGVTNTTTPAIVQNDLPFSPPKAVQPLILTHKFDTVDPLNANMPIKFAAYNLLHTSLILLTEDGKLTALDIETGRVTGTVDNVAETALDKIKSTGRVQAIDVNVLRGREVVITSREGVLRSVNLS